MPEAIPFARKRPVRHRVKRWFGILVDSTEDPAKYEDPADPVGFVVRLLDGRTVVASPFALEIVPLQEAHKEHLFALRLLYRGSRKPFSKKHRATRCDTCQADATLQQDLECAECGWRLCVCGSCGCGPRSDRIRAHRQRLEALGLPDPGFRESTANTHRLPNCWHCKVGLDSWVDVECAACHWLLCVCGACGCGYNRP